MMKKLTYILPYAGALPFIFCAICLALDVDQLPVLGSTTQTMVVYGLIIASFMAGVHWGQHLNLKDKWRIKLAVFSNIIAVSLWVAFITTSGHALISFLTFAFMGLLFIDFKLVSDGHISKEYFRTRAIVTMIVILSLTFAGIYI